MAALNKLVEKEVDTDERREMLANVGVSAHCGAFAGVVGGHAHLTWRLCWACTSHGSELSFFSSGLVEMKNTSGSLSQIGASFLLVCWHISPDKRVPKAFIPKILYMKPRAP